MNLVVLGSLADMPFATSGNRGQSPLAIVREDSSNYQKAPKEFQQMSSCTIKVKRTKKIRHHHHRGLIWTFVWGVGGAHWQLQYQGNLASIRFLFIFISITIIFILILDHYQDQFQDDQSRVWFIEHAQKPYRPDPPKRPPWHGDTSLWQI